MLVPLKRSGMPASAKAYGEEKATAIVAGLKQAYPEKKIQTLSCAPAAS